MPLGARAGLAAGGALIAVASFLFARASGWLGAPAPKPSSSAVLAPPSPATPSAPVLAAPDPMAPQAPVLGAPPAQAVPMPEDVIAYLRWLKAYDRSLRDLQAELEGVGVAIIPEIYSGLAAQAMDDESTPPPAGSGVVSRLEGLTSRLNGKTGEFRSQPPPEPCGPLALAYQQALDTAVVQCGSLVATFGKIAATFTGNVNSGAADRSAMLPDLMKEIKGGAMSRDADGQFRASGEALDALRARYTQIPSDIDRGAFRIEPLDSGMDPTRFLMGKPGF
ncbi:MAG: hypothetical protein ACKO5K_14945 [Armatimonadota bacterium]